MRSHDNTAYYLVDFDNFFKYDHQTETFDFLTNFFNKICSDAHILSVNTTNIAIRIYGGWKREGAYTNLASRLTTKIAEIDFFPVSKPDSGSTIDGEIVLVTNLLAIPDIEWDNTVRTWPGLPRLRLSGLQNESNCNNDQCPARLLRNFSKHPNRTCHIENCRRTNRDMFVHVEQKMVDAMICCDIIHLLNSTATYTTILSNDYDLLPPIALASRSQGGFSKIRLIRTNNNHTHAEVRRLSDRGLTIQTWSTQ